MSSIHTQKFLSESGSYLNSEHINSKIENAREKIVRNLINLIAPLNSATSKTPTMWSKMKTLLIK